MFILPTQQHFRDWQIWWYTKRLSEVTDVKAKRYFRSQLKLLKQ